MSERTGTTINCDRTSCDRTEFGATPDDARGNAERFGWTRTDDGRDFCPTCTEIRANRKKASDFVPEGVRLMTPFDAANAAGWERRDYDEESGEAHFYCCGSEVDVSAIIGIPYYAKCETCGTAIGDVLGPSFGKSSVAMADPDKVDTEDPHTWVVVAEYEAAREARAEPTEVAR